MNTGGCAEESLGKPGNLLERCSSKPDLETLEPLGSAKSRVETRLRSKLDKKSVCELATSENCLVISRQCLNQELCKISVLRVHFV